LEVSQDELVMLNNALNEVLHGIDIPEFHARIGAERDAAEKLLAEVGRIVAASDA
jgi:hypothetical protein